jgi:glycosyltransferase involved in cell wall biosynthesis
MRGQRSSRPLEASGHHGESAGISQEPLEAVTLMDDDAFLPADEARTVTSDRANPAGPALFLSIVIPAYNEAQRIGKSLHSIRHYLEGKRFGAEVIVVDDGSTDSTAEVVARAARGWPALSVVRNPANRGKGFSVRRGVLEARGKYVLFTDADLSASIDQAGVLIAALEATGADAAIGSRALQRELIGVHQPWFREWAGICFNWVVRLLTGLRLRDTQCGLKLFRRDTTRQAFEHLKAQGFGFDPELLFLIERWGGRIIEIAVRWDHDPVTRFSILRDASRSLEEVLAVRWRAWTGGYPPAKGAQASAAGPDTLRPPETKPVGELFRSG